MRSLGLGLVRGEAARCGHTNGAMTRTGAEFIPRRSCVRTPAAARPAQPKAHHARD